VIDHPAFVVDPWSLCERTLDLERLAQTESVFALANGHIGLRGNLDEGEPSGMPGTYLNGFYEVHQLPYAEAGYGNPEASQVMVNITDGKVIRLLVEDEPFDVRYGELRTHERTLDMRAGVLERTVEWVSPTGRVVRVRSTRLVSFTQRAVAAVLYEVEALDDPLRVVLQSELVANEQLPGEDDPRGFDATPRLDADAFGHKDPGVASLVHTTEKSGLTVGASMDHVVEAPDGIDTSTESFPDVARFTVAADLAPGKSLRLVKFLAYGWSSQRSSDAIRDQVRAALAEARHTGWEGLAREQRSYLDDFWSRADVEIDGDAELQQAVRFALFHTLQSGARAEQRAIPAKGLTGPGYDGHAFWDSEAFVLQVLTYTVPRAARDALAWRHRTLELARERAGTLGLSGAAFPWRTISGRECSGYWPAGAAAFHVSSAIANAVVRYQAATLDDDFDTGIGLDLLVETARLWRSLGHHDDASGFRIDGVTGPDEYSAVADNNVYTNLMAELNMREAAAAAERHPKHAARLHVTPEEAASWNDAARAMLVPFDSERRVHPQAESFTKHAMWDFEQTRADQYPLFLHFPYFELYRKQVVKQADLVLALHLRGDAFTDEEKARDFAYYEALTVRDSSLSAPTQAVLAAEVGQLELAYDYLCEAALIDLDDLQHNTRDGLHIASLAGTWIGVVAGFGGMRDHNATLSFAPRLPPAITRIAFRMMYRGRRLMVEVAHDEATYSLADGEPLGIVHHGDEHTLKPGEPAVLPLPPPPVLEPPQQPAGRAPARRGAAR
jgi:alpha,alpha-trehalose phosphorylase